MTKVGMDVDAILSVVAAILHITSVEFEAENDGLKVHMARKTAKNLEWSARLLGVPQKEL
eukprot:SAG31_NODE_8993_length_1351_cov_1.322684_1_plen_59_part_10